MNYKSTKHTLLRDATAKNNSCDFPAVVPPTSEDFRLTGAAEQAIGFSIDESRNQLQPIDLAPPERLLNYDEIHATTRDHRRPSTLEIRHSSSEREEVSHDPNNSDQA
jgi:hypothetical protein